MWEDRGRGREGTDGRLSVRCNDANNQRNSETLTRRGREMLDPRFFYRGTGKEMSSCRKRTRISYSSVIYRLWAQGCGWDFSKIVQLEG